MAGLASLLALALPGAAPLPAPPSAHRAHAVLSRHCAACHDGQGPKRNRGGLDFVLDLGRLVSRGQVVPGRPAASPLLRRVAAGEMPPGKKHSFRPGDQKALQDWVADGAPGLVPAGRPLRSSEVAALVLADIKAVPARERRHMRYLSLGPLGGGERAEIVRRAAAKAANSLSWHPRVTRPHAVAPLVLRLDLRDYRWAPRLWDRLAAVYPYRERGELTGPPRDVAKLTGADTPILRADWFVATATRPPFYHDFLALPLTDRGLERVAGVDVAAATREDRAYRAGFNKSGVARSNRVLERVDGLHGAYWRSHDFLSNTGRENIFERPASFKAAGGEIIFHLPNGLQGYLIVDGDGNRLDKAPGEVVQDPSRPDRLVENGLSCMGCHSAGIIPKDDEVRAHVLANRKAFEKETAQAALALYVPPARLRRRVDEDNERFSRALARLGISPKEREPVLAAVLDYERVLGRAELAAELNTDEAGLKRLLDGVPELARAVAAGKGGTVQRELLEELYPRLVEAGNPAPREKPALHTGHKGPVRSVSLASGWLLSGGADGQVLLARASGGPARLVVKHAGDVEAVALSPDGKLAASAVGREAFVHDAATGKLVVRLRGHTGEVRAMAFLNSAKLVTAGADRTGRIWDVGSGAEVAALVGHTNTVTCVTIARGGKIVITGSTDRTVRWWDARGREQGRRSASAEVHCAAWEAGTLAAGTSRGEVLLWDTRRAGPPKLLRGPDGTIRAVAVFRGGRVAAVASRGPALWRWAAGKQYKSDATGPVSAAAFAPDGAAALAGDGVRTVPAR